MNKQSELYSRISVAVQNHCKLVSGRGVAARIAKDLDIEPGAVSKWKKGKAFPSNENIRRIAEMYNVSEEYLVGLEDQPGVPREITDLERQATEVIWRAARYSSNLPVPEDAGYLFKAAVEYLAEGKSKEEALGKILSMLD